MISIICSKIIQTCLYINGFKEIVTLCRKQSSTVPKLSSPFWKEEKNGMLKFQARHSNQSESRPKTESFVVTCILRDMDNINNNNNKFESTTLGHFANRPKQIFPREMASSTGCYWKAWPSILQICFIMFGIEFIWNFYSWFAFDLKNHEWVLKLPTLS